MAQVNFMDYFFPVIGGANREDGLNMKQLYGTCTYIKNNLFITAGHTVKNALEDDVFGIGQVKSPGNFWNFIPAIDYDIIKDIDLAVIRTDTLKFEPTAIKIDPGPLSLLESIWTGGFPHGYDRTNIRIVNRALKGNIVSAGPLLAFPSKPKSYELSFNCPMGISGAPIISTRPKGNECIFGYIVGNSQADLIVNEYTEIETSTGTEKIYKQMNTTQFGIAINTSEVLKRKSNLFNGSAEVYFSDNSLL